MNKYAIDYLTNEESRYMYIVESKLSQEDFERNIERSFQNNKYCNFRVFVSGKIRKGTLFKVDIKRYCIYEILD